MSKRETPEETNTGYKIWGRLSSLAALLRYVNVCRGTFQIAIRIIISIWTHKQNQWALAFQSVVAGWEDVRRGPWEGIGVEKWWWLDNEEVKNTTEREGGRSGQGGGENEGKTERHRGIESKRRTSRDSFKREGWGVGYLANGSKQYCVKCSLGVSRLSRLFTSHFLFFQRMCYSTPELCHYYTCVRF